MMKMLIPARLFNRIAILAISVISPALATTIEPVVEGTAHEFYFSIDYDNNLGVVTGSAGQILETRDGGNNWDKIKVDTDLALVGVDVRDHHAIAVGQMGTIARRNSANRWTVDKLDTDERLLAVDQGGNGIIVIGGGFGTVLLSDDDGASWRNIAPDWSTTNEEGLEPHIYTVVIDESNTIYIGGEFGLIMSSADLGKSWRIHHQGDASIFDMQLRNDGIGFAVGQNNLVLHTTDHGNTWNTLRSMGTVLWFGVYSRNDNVVVSGMREMLVSSNGGETWTTLEDKHIKAYWFSDIEGFHGGPVYGVGQHGQIIRVTMP